MSIKANMAAKVPYKLSRIGQTVRYYPLDPIRFTRSTLAKIEKFMTNNRLMTAYEERLERCPPIRATDAIMGIEVEAEKVSPNLITSAPPFWTSVADNSLRNGGREFLSLPSDPETTRRNLVSLITLFRDGKYGMPDFSWRTSIHVHLNMREERIEQFLNFLVLYLLFEDSIFAFVGRDRQASNFCIPVQETDMSYAISRMLVGKARLPQGLFTWQKYSALNPRPILYNDHAGGPGDSIDNGKGTIEFRHMGGTYSLSQIIQWLNIILSLQAASRRYSSDYIEERVTEMGTRAEYVAFQEDIFDGLLPMPPRDFSSILYSSVAYAKECFCPIPSVDEIVASSKRKSTGLVQMLALRTRGASEEPPKKKVRAPGLSHFDGNTLHWDPASPVMANLQAQAFTNGFYSVHVPHSGFGQAVGGLPPAASIPVGIVAGTPMTSDEFDTQGDQ